MSDRYRNALQSIVSDYAHMEGGTDRTDYYASIALAALNTPPPAALQADRAAVGAPAGWRFDPHDRGIIVTAPDGGGVLVDPENGSIAGIVLWELASALLANKPTDEAPAKCEQTVAELFASIPDNQIDVACEAYNRAVYDWMKQSDRDEPRNRYAMRAVVAALQSQDSPT